MVISEEDAFRHLQRLIDTETEAGRSKADVDRLDEQRKTIEAIAFLTFSGSAAERKQKALASTPYLEHLKQLEDARFTFEILKQKRLTSIIAIDMWRSINSNMKKGNI